MNYDDHPVVPDDYPVPAPSQAVVGGARFVFTALGALAVVLWRRRRITAAAWALAGYSVSGLVGFGHYTAPGAFDMVWWRQTHVVADILCGLAVIVFALWAARNAPRLAAEGPGPERPPPLVEKRRRRSRCPRWLRCPPLVEVPAAG